MRIPGDTQVTNSQWLRRIDVFSKQDAALKNSVTQSDLKAVELAKREIPHIGLYQTSESQKHKHIKNVLTCLSLFCKDPRLNSKAQIGMRSILRERSFQKLEVALHFENELWNLAKESLVELAIMSDQRFKNYSVEYVRKCWSLVDWLNNSDDLAEQARAIQGLGFICPSTGKTIETDKEIGNLKKALSGYIGGSNARKWRELNNSVHGFRKEAAKFDGKETETFKIHREAMSRAFFLLARAVDKSQK